jgi:pimeloyl-ACP methyl ester carboxylesterase
MNNIILLLLALPASIAPGEPPAALEGGLPGSRTLLVALHGGTFTDRPPLELAQRLLTDLSSEARAAGLRLLVPVAPAAPDTAEPGRYVVPWLRPDGEALVWSLVERERAARRLAGERVLLAGHGAGATGALTLAARHPDRVAAVAAWSGTPEPLWDDQQRVVALAEPIVAGLKTVPTVLFTAHDDPWLDRPTLSLFLEGLQAQAAASPDSAPFLHLQGEGGHGFGRQGPARALRFLRDHAKPQSRPRKP